MASFFNPCFDLFHLSSDYGRSPSFYLLQNLMLFGRIITISLLELEIARFCNWKNSLESKGLKVNTRKIKVMVSGSEEELFKSKINPCGVCGRRVMADSLLCTKCGNWICAKIKRATTRLAMHFVYLKCKGIMEGTMNAIEKLCDEVETVNGSCYLGDSLTKC